MTANNKKENLNKFFGFTRFLPGQKKVIDLVLAGKSAAALFPTGAGKSLCYQLPAMHLPGLTLVVSPLLSLMKDQLDFLLEKGLPAAKLDSLMDRAEYASVLEQAKSGELKILMISVERFRNERFRIQLKSMNISLLVVDEAHCISEWGHNFRPEYLKVPVYKKEFNINQILLLTATATPKVCSDMCEKFGLEPKSVVKTGFYRKNLFLQVSPMPDHDKNQALVNRLSRKPEAPTIIYVTLQKTAENVADFLQSKGIEAQAYHAGLDKDRRIEVQNNFMSGKLFVVAATIAFGMGIDKNNIRRVIHYDLPKSIESYSQEIGRAGRDNKASLCEVLANTDSLRTLENFACGDTPEKQAIKTVLQNIADAPAQEYEIRLRALSKETDIRELTLKTLLVYLELAGIIRPKYTFFENYPFKFLQGPEWIADKFVDERKTFVQNIFANTRTAKVWSKPDIDAVAQNYNAPRERILTALDYFDAKGWIELTASGAVDVYRIENKNFDIDALCNNLHSLFKKKEQAEVERVHNLVNFFQGSSCLSQSLSNYFGEDNIPDCGYCSFCKNGKIKLESYKKTKPLSEYNFAGITQNFFQAVEDDATPVKLARFLCGLASPLTYAKKLRQFSEFGILEDQPYKDVLDWAEKHCANQ